MGMSSILTTIHCSYYTFQYIIIESAKDTHSDNISFGQNNFVVLFYPPAIKYGCNNLPNNKIIELYNRFITINYTYPLDYLAHHYHFYSKIPRYI